MSRNLKWSRKRLIRVGIIAGVLIFGLLFVVNLGLDYYSSQQALQEEANRKAELAEKEAETERLAQQRQQEAQKEDIVIENTSTKRNRLERILQIFDQEYCVEGNEHYLELDESKFDGDDFIVINRLMMACGTPELKRAMEVEDEILSEIEERDTTIMIKDKEIKQKTQEIKQKTQEIEQKTQEIEQKTQEIEQKTQEIEQKDMMIKGMAILLHEQGIPDESIAEKLNLPVDYIKSLLN